MSLRPYKSDVEMWKRYFGGTSSLTTNPVATVARASKLLKRHHNIKGGAQKKSVSRKRTSKGATSKKALVSKKASKKKQVKGKTSSKKNTLRKTRKTAKRTPKIVCCDYLS